MFVITNYRQLKVDQVYRVFDSLGESHEFQYRGCHFSNEINDMEMFFWTPGTNDLVAQWPLDEFKGAVDAAEAQKEYELLCDEVVARMRDEDEPFMFALLNWERSRSGRSFVNVLYYAGKSLNDFQEMARSR